MIIDAGASLASALGSEGTVAWTFTGVVGAGASLDATLAGADATYFAGAADASSALLEAESSSTSYLEAALLAEETALATAFFTSLAETAFFLEGLASSEDELLSSPLAFSIAPLRAATLFSAPFN